MDKTETEVETTDKSVAEQIREQRVDAKEPYIDPPEEGDVLGRDSDIDVKPSAFNGVPNDENKRIQECQEAVERVLREYQCYLNPRWAEPEAVGKSGSVVQLTAFVQIKPFPLR